MNYDWTVVSSIATAIASFATALGVIFGAWQIRISKKQAQAEFEDSLDQQYRVISMKLPVDILIGKNAEKADKNQIRELIYNYLDLTNEQVYLRAKRRISKITWQSWSTGIKAHIERPAFSEVFHEIKHKSGFTYLERLVDCNFDSDPIDWYKK